MKKIMWLNETNFGINEKRFETFLYCFYNLHPSDPTSKLLVHEIKIIKFKM